MASGCGHLYFIEVCEEGYDPNDFEACCDDTIAFVFQVDGMTVTLDDGVNPPFDTGVVPLGEYRTLDLSAYKCGDTLSYHCANMPDMKGKICIC